MKVYLRGYAGEPVEGVRCIDSSGEATAASGASKMHHVSANSQFKNTIISKIK